MIREKAEEEKITASKTSELAHLLIIPDGGRRYARRSYLADLFGKSIRKFRLVLQGLLQKDASVLEERIKNYIRTGKDPFYYDEKNPDDLLYSNKILVPKNYFLSSYRKGGEVITSLIKWILENRAIEILSIYGVQKRNLDRPDEETYAILKVEAEVFQNWINDEIITSQFKVKFVGDKRIFNKHRKRDSLRKVIQQYLDVSRRLEERSSGNNLKIYILAPYDRKWEINQAVINGKFDPKRLVVNEDVDLIIRAGYSKTPISGALPYQTAYSQFISVKEYFEDFTTDRFRKILKEYKGKRESGL